MCRYGGGEPGLTSVDPPHIANEFGGLSTLIPSKAARFKRLQLLQGQLTRSVQHVAGLNPKAYR